jgi:hypothetical protein
MKTLLRSLLCAGLLLATTTYLFADLPALIDPRKDADTFEGAGFVFKPAYLTAHYLIITCPNENNPERKFFTFEASLDPSVKIDGPGGIKTTEGTFVEIRAVRVTPKKEGEPTLKIISLHEIRKF